MKLIARTLLFCLIGLQCMWGQEHPNIVYIICDDLGYGDVAALNPERGKIPTPEIDALAREGITFTDAHSGSSVCTPSRYSILTGRYAWRSRLQEGVLRGGDEFDPLIAENRLTVPKMLKKVGYTTAAMGKWHLGFRYLNDEGKEFDLYEGKKLLDIPIGSTVPDGPITRGFDSYIGFHHSAAMKNVIKDDKVIDHMPPIRMLQFLGDHATAYIKEQSTQKKPFFLYLALNSPHSPVVPSEAWQGKSGMGSYADFVMETDFVVGRVLKALKENGLDENTLVFFTSDNGCSFPVAKGHKLEKEFGHYPSAHFRGAKSDIWEGGHRIPFIVSWPGIIEAGAKSDELVSLASLMATCAELTGAPMGDEDGEDSISILPLLKNAKAKSDHKMLVHHSINGKFSIRKGKWKLELTPGSGGWSAPTDGKARDMGLPKGQLYNMKKDPEERLNLYTKHPKVVKRLTAELREIVENGRTTPGKKLGNDVPVDIFKEGR
ncbi:sulfatase family protein [Pseudozobellia thermophila]|uniref:Arylsulfatase A n=1 Tax=Pseudozobellia thermophila TaxID=192903 RepID=A0A1M6DBH3_9FLAO|nr:arylsulfatase [Pseudozobellia thermophila]SHI70553.1 Arylsulfatase A [Pseudozobellia thermophila]